MACIRARRNRYVLDWRDRVTRKRRWRTFPLTPEGLAKAEGAKALVEVLRPGAIDPGIVLGAYLENWLRIVGRRVSHGTVLGYSTIRRHVRGALWRTRVMDLNRPTIKAWVAYLQGTGLGRSMVARMLSVMRSLLNEAVDDGLLSHNPAHGLGRSLGLDARARRNKPVRAMDEDQLATFLAVARIQQPEHFYRFAVLAYAGLRSGECRGLQAQDIDFDRKRIHVERQVYLYGGSGLPKGSKTRDVELGDALAGILAECIAARREFDMRTGRRSPWLLFPEFAPEPTRAEAGAATARVAVAMKACLMAAGLPEHFTPHCLRHTFATVQLSRGESLLYVARQLGDTLQITAETYGAWARVPSTAGGPNLLTSGRDRLGRQEG